MTVREGGTPIVLRDMALRDRLPSSALDLYVWLRDTFGHAGTFSVTQREIRAQTGKGPNTIARALRSLESSGALEIVEHGTGRNPNVYRLPVFAETPLPWRSVVRVRPADRRYLLAIYGPEATGFRRIGVRRLGRTVGRSPSSAHRALRDLRRARLIHRVAPGTWNPAAGEGDEAAYAFRVTDRRTERHDLSRSRSLALSDAHGSPAAPLARAVKPYVPRGLDHRTGLPRPVWPAWRPRRDWFPYRTPTLFDPEPARRAARTVPTDVSRAERCDRVTEPTPETERPWWEPEPITDEHRRLAAEAFARITRKKRDHAPQQ